MDDLIHFLKSQNFKTEDNIERLKVTVSGVKHEDFDTDIPSPDLRYFWDGKATFGLHISIREFSQQEWFELESLLRSNDEFVKVLYISGTNLMAFDFGILPNLTFLNLSENKQLISLVLENAPQLTKLIFSHCPVLKQIILRGRFNSLEKVDVSYCESLQDIKLPTAPNLEYLLALATPIKKIDWADRYPKIKLIEVDTKDFTDDALKRILQNTDDALRDSLNDYLRVLNAFNSEKIKRLKLILIGNTTIGKSTLRRIILSDKNQETNAAKTKESSTHGVYFFNDVIVDNDEKIYIQGFDFGGQDYYHATHLPFYEYNSLNLLVYGYNPSGNLKGNTDAYEFGRKNVDGYDEVLFPIDYWLGSIMTDDENENRKTDIIPEDTTIEKPEVETKPQPKAKKTPKVELIQNVFEKSQFQEVNNYELRRDKKYNIDEIINFDFHNEASKLKKWVLDKIIANAQEREILSIDKQIGEYLTTKQSNVVYTETELLEIDLVKEHYEKSNLKELLKRLHTHHYGYFVEFPKNSFFIADIGKFSGWIHNNILKKELVKNGGYIEESLKKSLKAEVQPHWQKLIAFLEKENIIFKLPDGDKKWVAPAYLGQVENKAEQLLLESFEKPDVVVQFNDFFHSNILLMLIDKFQGDLVYDAKLKEYLMWKNKVILHQQSSEKNAFLLIELRYPYDDGFENKKPELHIRRNQAAYIDNELFRNVFGFIKRELENINTEIKIKTKFDDYIPYTCLTQNNTQDKKERSNLIYHNQTFFSVFDFKHFMDGSEISKPNKIFIGYSRHDIDYVEELLLHLRPYEKMGKAVVFYDRDLKMGDKWDEELKYQLANSDIFVCLVSPYMLNTAYVTDLELPLANQKKIKIAPIIITECNWQVLEFNNKIDTLGDNNANNKAAPLSTDKAIRNGEWKIIAQKLIETSNV